MKPIPNFDKITADAPRERLKAGGYVIKITQAEDKTASNYLRIVYDIAEGPEANRYNDEWGKEHDFAHAFVRAYRLDPKDERERKINGMFKTFTNALEDSNPGYKWAWDEKTLPGKILGVVLGEEEYRTNRGDVNVRLYVSACTSADKIRAGEYKVPALKALKEDPAANMNPAPEVQFNEDDLPF